MAPASSVPGGNEAGGSFGFCARERAAAYPSSVATSSLSLRRASLELPGVASKPNYLKGGLNNGQPPVSPQHRRPAFFCPQLRPRYISPRCGEASTPRPRHGTAGKQTVAMEAGPPISRPRHDHQEPAMPSRIVTWTYREAQRLVA